MSFGQVGSRYLRFEVAMCNDYGDVWRHCYLLVYVLNTICFLGACPQSCLQYVMTLGRFEFNRDRSWWLNSWICERLSENRSGTLFLGTRDYLRHCHCHGISNERDNDSNISFAKIREHRTAKKNFSFEINSFEVAANKHVQEMFRNIYIF